jgi:cytochrome c-type biogenesis protein
MDWYNQFVQFLTFFTEPLSNLYYSQETPILGALLLGLLGALAPCQISANMGALSYSVNRMTQEEKWYQGLVSFFLGKTVVYFVLGIFIIWLGKGLEEMTIPVFQVVQKMIGPLFLLTGLYFIGIVKIQGLFTQKVLKYREFINKFSGNAQGFLLGVLLSLAFCPTMFLLFFGLLIPLALNTTGYGFFLPLLFSLGTMMPVLLFIGLTFGFGLEKSLLKNTKKVGRMVQIISGFILILIGINDIILYWISL